MNINFDKIFLNENGGLKEPEIIAESLLLIKDINQSYGIKLAMIDWLSNKGYKTSFLPEISAIYDYARDITGMGAGKEIREEDFIVLMERADIEGLSNKFKGKKFRNYKKSLFRLLNYTGLSSSNRLDKDIINDLEANGLNEGILEDIKIYINSFDFYFKGQIFDTAIQFTEKESTHKNIFVFNLYKEEISSKEREFLKYLNAGEIEFEHKGKYAGLADVFDNKPSEVAPEGIDFYVSESAMDEAKKIKHLILSNVESMEYDFEDFTVVCSDENSFKIMNNLFLSSKLPVYSSYGYIGSDISTDILRLFTAGLNGDAQTILNFYNLYIADEPVKFDDLSEIDIESLWSKLSRGSGSDMRLNFKTEKDYKIRKTKEDVIRKFLKILNLKDGELDIKKAVIKLYYMIKEMKELLSIEIEFDPYQFEETLLKIFGIKIIFSEMLEYLYLISSKSNKIKPNREQRGVRINMMNEPVSGCKYLILSGLSEDEFLKSSNSVKIIQKENYKKLYESVYGIDGDKALLENFRIFTSGDTEKLAMFIPQWGDEIIVSTKIDHLLALFPKKILDIRIIPDKYGLNSCNELTNRSFCLDLKDIIDDEKFVKTIEFTVERDQIQKNDFSISYSEDNIEEKLVSASKIESFMTCPAKFVHESNLKYDEIESLMPYTKGNFFHETTEKFLKYFKGKDLLVPAVYDQALEDFSYREKISNSAISMFEEFYFGEIDSTHEKYKNSFQILADKIRESGIDEAIEKFISEQTANNPYGSYNFKKQKYEIVGFIARLIIEIGQTPLCVTSTFATEVKFGEMIVSESPKIVIKEGYIDFMFVDFKGNVRLYDIKSTIKFKDFEDEIKEYQKVQLLLYKTGVIRRIKGEAGINFDMSAEGRNPNCTILGDDYFKRIDPETEVKAYYISSVSPYILS
ncbi:MAG: PD-(D/E)XK nuclease family protein, partial [Candidatus Delongbacteria bacterium]|nr:PD-(D/E)XK nuclease family protein [Candidatus Delongbacteria bacterium]MCG2760885.1 PD-(D/E)XK nuclease family protein [Candidatus Delongbacteria bacterium]